MTTWRQNCLLAPPGFYPKLVYVGFVVVRFPLEQDLTHILWFYPVSHNPIYAPYSFIIAYQACDRPVKLA
jgi:hypothetical protein